MARTSSIHGFFKESVGLRGYGQKDPLIEYKNEGYDMFLEMMTNMRRNVIYSMFMFQPKTDADEKNKCDLIFSRKFIISLVLKILSISSLEISIDSELTRHCNVFCNLKFHFQADLFYP